MTLVLFWILLTPVIILAIIFLLLLTLGLLAACVKRRCNDHYNFDCSECDPEGIYIKSREPFLLLWVIATGFLITRPFNSLWWTCKKRFERKGWGKVQFGDVERGNVELDENVEERTLLLIEKS
jgi:hypothetical protein